MRALVVVLVGLAMSGSLCSQELPDLSADARLQERMSLAEPFVSLHELIQKVQAQTGAPLAVAPEIADDKLCVLVAQKPASEILTRVAETLRYQWVWGTDGQTYVLRMPASERQRERDLYQLALRTEQQRQRDALAQLVALAHQYSFSQVEQLLDSDDFYKHAKRELRNALVELSNPATYCAVRALGLLPAALKARIWTAYHITLGSPHHTAADAPLPPAAEQTLLRLLRETRLIEEANVRLKSVQVFYRPCSKLITVLMVTVSDEGIERQTNGSLSLDWRSIPTHSAIDSHSLCKVWREWQSDLAELTSLPKVPREGQARETPLPEPLRGSALVALINWARGRNLNLYADAYRIRTVRYPRHSRKPISPTFPSDEVADLFFETVAPMFWLRLEGDTLMARHKDYYWLRLSEIPERLLRPLEAKVAAREPISLDDWANFATALTPMQLERLWGGLRMNHQSGEQVFHETPIPMDMVLHTLPALRFWASLTPAQRAHAQQGNAILLERLTPSQRQRFREALRPQLFSDCVSQEATAPSITITNEVWEMQFPEYWFGASVRSLPASEARPERFEMRVFGIAPPSVTSQVEGRLTITLGASAFQEPSHATDKSYRLSFIAEGKERVYVVYQTVPSVAGGVMEIPRSALGEGAAVIAPSVTIR